MVGTTFIPFDWCRVGTDACNSRTLIMVSDKVGNGTAVNNTLRQIFAAIGSSMVVVMVAVWQKVSRLQIVVFN
ncbi:hypothetical protein [uncultured Methanobrevibacter sp.]|uniref:hypothetical protein n=1 Tax=uncultured Methanobrevibacter sp. TaxID=253161 RepID=UPI0025D22085|nr:hypothetical protein [uncultured Methanobrevibacter sp.]